MADAGGSVEYSFMFLQRRKLMVIKQQLQVTNFAASLGRSQAGRPCNRQPRVVDLEGLCTL